MWWHDVLDRLLTRPVADTPDLRVAREQVEEMRRRREAIIDKRRVGSYGDVRLPR